MFWSEPEDNTSESLWATERSMQFGLGWFAHPVFVNGNYPYVMIDQVLLIVCYNVINKSVMPYFIDLRLAEKVPLKVSTNHACPLLLL